MSGKVTISKVDIVDNLIFKMRGRFGNIFDWSLNFAQDFLNHLLSTTAFHNHNINVFKKNTRRYLSNILVFITDYFIESFSFIYVLLSWFLFIYQLV